MAQPSTLLDTDTLSAIMRRHPIATATARIYLDEHHRFTFSAITRYEVLRGLRARNASIQLAAFEQLCATSNVLPITDTIIDEAAHIFADLYRRGSLIGDADILIAATAIKHGHMLATNNEAHFRRITGLVVVNWLT